MVSRNADIIDFQKLEGEVHAAVEADARYWRENDAKFRAVNQRVATYEEFRDIVLASHLKPIDKGEGLDNIQKNQPWNKMVQAGVPPTNTTQTSASDSPNFLGKKPSNGHEFSRAWSRLCKNDTDKYSYLMWVGPHTLRKIFKMEISFGLLGEVLGCLDKDYTREHCLHVLAILDTLGQANRFKLSVDFLSDKEKQSSISLFKKVQDDVASVSVCSLCEQLEDNSQNQCSPDADQELLVTLMQKYNAEL